MLLQIRAKPGTLLRFGNFKECYDISEGFRVDSIAIGIARQLMDTILKLDEWPNPAVLIGTGGELIQWNPSGRLCLESYLQHYPFWLEERRGESAFKQVISDNLLLKATFLTEQQAYFLEWCPVSETDIQLALIQAVSRAVNASLIFEEIFDALAEVLQHYISFQSGRIVILDESQNKIRVVVVIHDNGDTEVRSDHHTFSGYDTVLADLLRSASPMCLGSPFSDSILTDSNSSEAIIVPLMSKGILIGAISLMGQAFSPLHQNLLEEASAQLAVAVENARLYWQTQNQASQAFLINQITKSIRQSLNIQQILETTVQELGKVLGLSRCMIHYWGSEAESFEHFEYVFPGILPIGSTHEFVRFERQLFLRREESAGKFNPFILNDCRTYTQDGGMFTQEGIKSLAVFPILFKEGAFVGTITLHQCDAYRSWLGEEIDLLKAIAEHVAVALHQANLFDEKEQQRQQLENTLNELKTAQMHLIQSEKMAVLGQFVAGIAHEVNTPLGTLRANDDTVKRCLEQLLVADDKSQKFQKSALDLLEINRLASDRIQEIVKNLRNFARLDESDLKLINLQEGLDSTLLLIESAWRGKIRIEKNYGEIPLIQCFPGLLNQVFMNILVNAGHSIEEKGIIRIDTHLIDHEQQVEIAITDSGKGIAPEHLPRIFDPGFTTKGVGVGTGLGLALCYKIMEKHHGRILVDSTVGVGTTMRVQLPVRQPI